MASITRTREAPPDPSIAKAVGRHHTFETAIADLVDNSLDAGASNILVRFVEQNGAITGLQLIDDGSGMDAEQIDAAMEFARRRNYGTSDQGHFGLGLKAASLSQADRLNVYSRRSGVLPEGRTIAASAPTLIGDLDDDGVASLMTSLKVDFPFSNGTVVEWVGPRKFLSSEDARDRARWLDSRISALKAHLGIVFHRHIQNSRVRIAIDVFDTEAGESGPPRRVTAVDPFGYSPLPNDQYPASLVYSVGGVSASAVAHVWPATQAGLPEFRLGGRPGSLAQGFYFYRNDRLLQVGGWNNLTVEKPELEYVRVAVDLDEAIGHHFTINPEKAGLELDSDLRQALLDARLSPDGLAFNDFLAAAEDRRRENRRYVKRPVELAHPSRGFSPAMREAFADSIDKADSGPISIRWQVEASESPVRVDIENRTLWLNSAYRGLLAGSDSADNEDASFVKTLLLLHYSKYFEGSYLGSREKAEIEAWDQLLTAAARDETTRQEKELRNDTDR